MVWWKANPKEYELFQRELAEFEGLRIEVVADQIHVLGRWTVFGETKIIERFEIKIEIPEDFPFSVPRVFEIGSVLGKSPNDHFNSDDSACLFVEPERYRKWPPGSGIRDFLNGPVREFFFSQAYRRLSGTWPFGEWSHGNLGILEFYGNHFGTKSVAVIKGLLEASLQSRLFRQWRCPCGTNKRLLKCHGDSIKSLNYVPDTERQKGIDICAMAISKGTQFIK